MAIGVVFDWRRIARWCLLAALVMALWLLAPVVACSWGAFADTPIGDGAGTTADPSDVDAERVAQGTGFWNRFGGAVKVCYARTPLLGQEGWKANLLLALVVATVIARVLAYLDARRHRTFGDP